jgi:hypothetical protein
VLLIRIVIFLIYASFFLLIAGTVLAAFLALTGTPKPCVDRSVSPAPEANAEFQANWFALLQGVGQGEAVPLRVTEGQASILGDGYLEGRDVPVDNFRMYFCPDGTAEATGSLDTFGLSSKVLVRGTLNIDGPDPRVELDSIEVGNFPGFLSDKALDVLLKNRDVYTIPLAVTVTDLQVDDGEAIVTVAP